MKDLSDFPQDTNQTLSPTLSTGKEKENAASARKILDEATPGKLWESWFDGPSVSLDFMNDREQ